MPAEQIEAFRTNGFVVVDDLLTGDERTLEEHSPYQQSFKQCIG